MQYQLRKLLFLEKLEVNWWKKSRKDSLEPSKIRNEKGTKTCDCWRDGMTEIKEPGQ